eukprot:c23130_g1_i2 orf=359-643(+)
MRKGEPYMMFTLRTHSILGIGYSRKRLGNGREEIGKPTNAGHLSFGQSSTCFSPVLAYLSFDEPAYDHLQFRGEEATQVSETGVCPVICDGNDN